MKIIKTKELQLADTVRLYDDMPFNTAIVSQIKGGEISLFRPYGVSADFSYTGGVICYTGIEKVTLPSNDMEITLLERKILK